MTGGLEALLLLSDGRLPAGGYAHSGGLESAIALARVRGLDDLERFLVGRASTSGAVAAAFAAATCFACHAESFDTVSLLDREFRARTPSPALRDVSEILGRQLLRAMSAITSRDTHLPLPTRLNHPVAFGAAAAMLDLQPLDAARGMLHETVTGPAISVVKLQSVDPFDAHRVLVRLVPLLDELAESAAVFADADPSEMPSYSSPLSDLIAEHHAVREVRLFAS